MVVAWDVDRKNSDRCTTSYLDCYRTRAMQVIIMVIGFEVGILILINHMVGVKPGLDV